MWRYLTAGSGSPDYVISRIGPYEAIVADTQEHLTLRNNVAQIGVGNLLTRCVEKAHKLAMAALFPCLLGPEFQYWRLGRFRRVTRCRHALGARAWIVMKAEGRPKIQ